VQDAIFTPLAFDTNGSFGPSADRFMALIADKCDGDSRFDFHINRIAIAIQRGNATIVLEGLKRLPTTIILLQATCLLREHRTIRLAITTNPATAPPPRMEEYASM
jgi:hypothetical protein